MSTPETGDDVTAAFVQLSVVVAIAIIGLYEFVDTRWAALLGIAWTALVAAALFSAVGPRVTWVDSGGGGL